MAHQTSPRKRLLDDEDDDTSIFIDDPNLAYEDRVHGASSGIDNLLATGTHILRDLAEQDETMKVSNARAALASVPSLLSEYNGGCLTWAIA
ncbi:hypothetical protein PTSG_04313 [Salpingoeca rosetta]|uniref:Uncharacterized protein n=1 Tax=Salpingoeca rosetta (strain ATCC 50818 / BSB-021) TaxID=946362 RepID=F2U869_SALR5|nr:uncharacterized protein PTSG_04313 [Salpingoeca rosetta]EGD72577.1 hypothetical protein PTSG_04313 [Salpingoeca rosetta]|eukprot:XP_004994400.1 hypothetical protein PTSG_04313 [Salpingoeca rosetta]